MNICRTVGVSKSYFNNNIEIHAIIDCNLEIRAGECIAVSGVKNSGKSTLLRILGGMERPTEGSIFIGDKNISTYTDDELAIMRRKEIGYLFQYDSLIPELNIHENIIMPAILAHNKYNEDYYQDLVEHFYLKELLTYKPKQLSQHQLQSVIYARALMNNPDIILVDEPENSSGQKLDKSIQDFLQNQVYRYGKTLIMATEDTNFNIEIDHIIRLEHGVVVESRRT